MLTAGPSSARQSSAGPSSEATRAWALVCACASPRPTAALDARIAALCGGAPIDWDIVRALAERHRVTPLVAARLRSVAADAVPADVLEALTRRQRQITARNVHVATHLGAALERLEAAGLEACTFKGATLAVAAYGGLGLRTFDDLDLLVPREQIGQAAFVLRACGYRPAVELDQAQAAALIAQARPSALVHETARVTIDLHWSVTPRYFMSRLHADRLRAERTSIAVLGRAVPALASEALLAVLSVHGIKHCWGRLIWVSDIAALITMTGGLDWDRVAAHARAWQCERMIGVALALASDLLDAPVPEAAQRLLMADPAVRRLATRASARLQADADAGARGSGSGGGAAAQGAMDGVAFDPIAAARFHLASMGTWQDRFRYVRFVAQPSEADWHGSRVPAAASFLYYPLRALRVLAPTIRSKRP